MPWQKSVFVFAAFLLLLSGCTMSPPSMDLGKAQNFSFNGTGDNRNFGRDNCTVMLCQKGDTDSFWSWLFEFLGIQFTENSLHQGECRFDNKNSTQLINMIDSFLSDPSTIALPSAVPAGKDFIRAFMYGQGITFSEFDEANAYCNGNLSIVMKWMRNPSNLNVPPYAGALTWEKTLQRSKAECYLRANVIPVYIFYTNSTPSAMDSANMAQFLDNFKDSSGKEVGPIIIDPEFSYNISKPGVISKLKDLITTIHNNCEKCMIMVSPPEEDMASFDAIMGDPAIASIVNLTGQGWTLNMDEDCSFYSSFIRKLEFSRAVLAKYQKPTLLAYLAASNTLNYNKTCNWTDQSIKKAYDQTYLNTPALVSAGIIGISSYQLLDGQEAILKCIGENCSFGLMTGDEEQKPEEFPLWFDRCNKYYGGEVDAAGKLMELNRVPLVFNYFGDNGSTCDVLGNLGTYKMFRVSTDPQVFTTPVDKPGYVYNCYTCFWDSKAPRTSSAIPYTAPAPLPSTWYPGVPPGNFDDLLLALHWDPSTDSVISDSDYCSLYTASIGKASETGCKWMLDPLFVKAAAAHDSELDKCAVSYTRLSDTSCNPANKMSVTNPDTVGCIPPMQNLRYDTSLGACVSNTGQPGWAGWEQCKPCTYGLMRCPSLPYDQATYAGLQPSGCGPKFNPFDAQQGLCCGANSLCKSMDNAITWAYESDPGIITNLALSPTKDDWINVERDKWTVLLLTLATYHHNGNTAFIQKAYDSWMETKWCPNSLTESTRIVPTSGGPVTVTVQPEGPSKAFIWSYCTVKNNAGTVFAATTATPDPWIACLASGSPPCKLDCCNEAQIKAYNIAGTAFKEFDTTPGFAEIVKCTGLAGSDKCCNIALMQGLLGPIPFDPLNPDTYRATKKGVDYCCGGSFMEHLCCMDSYACEVLNNYKSKLELDALGNPTADSCDPKGFCRKA